MNLNKLFPFSRFFFFGLVNLLGIIIFPSLILADHDNPPCTNPQGCLYFISGDHLVSKGEEGGPFSPVKSLMTFENGTPGIIRFSASSDSNWLYIGNGGNGELKPGEKKTFSPQITSQAANLPSGNYKGNLVLTCSGTYCNKTYNEPVYLTVTPSKGLKVTGGGLNSSGREGGTFNPVSATYRLTNSSNKLIGFSISSSQSWMFVSRSSGTLGPNSSVNVIVSLNSDEVKNLSANIYTGRINFSDTTRNRSESRQITLKVFAIPPKIKSIQSAIVEEGKPFFGPKPELEEGSQPVDWTLVQKPDGMSINPVTGAAEWINPVANGPGSSSNGKYRIITEASNKKIGGGNLGGGTDRKSWDLTVTVPPEEKDPYANENLSCVADPIDVSLGSYVMQKTLLSIQGAIPLSFKINYNSSKFIKKKIPKPDLLKYNLYIPHSSGVNKINPSSWVSSGIYGGKFGTPKSLALQPETGNIFVLASTHYVTQINIENGNSFGIFGDTGKIGAFRPYTDYELTDIAVHPKTSNLLVAVLSKAQRLKSGVYEYDGATGKFLGILGQTAEYLYKPVGIAFHPKTGNLFVNNHIIPRPKGNVLEFDGATGKFLRVFGETEQILKLPITLAFHPITGNLFVTDNSEKGVPEFDGNEGKFIKRIGSLELKRGLANGLGFKPQTHGLLVGSAYGELLEFNGVTGIIQDRRSIKVSSRAQHFVFKPIPSSPTIDKPSLSKGWSHNLDIKLSEVIDGIENVIEIRLGTGQVIRFKRNGNGSFINKNGNGRVKLIKNSDGSFTFTDKDRSVYQFLFIPGSVANLTGPHYELATLTNHEGFVLKFSFSYPGQGIPGRTRLVANARFLERVTEPISGRFIKFTYDAKNRLTSAGSEGAGIYKFSYNDNDNLEVITDPLAHSIRYAYDGDHRLLSGTNELGARVFLNTYNEEGLIVSQDDALASTPVETLVYSEDQDGNKVHYYVDRNGAQTAYFLNNRFQLVKLWGELGNITEFGYDKVGNRTEIKDERGNATKIGYKDGYRTRIIDSLGRTSSVEYDGEGNTTVIRDNRSRRTVMTYEPTGNLFVAARKAVLEIDKYTGAFLGVFGETGANLEFSQGIAFHPTTRDLYVSDKGTKDVKVFDGNNGKFIRSLGGKNLISPNGLAFHPITGNLFVSETIGARHDVRMFNSRTGAFLGSFGQTANKLKFPVGLGFHPQTGNLYVADVGDDDVKVFDGSTGSFIKSIGAGILNNPSGLAFRPFSGNLLVSEIYTGTPRKGEVWQFDAISGNNLGIFGKAQGLGVSRDLTFHPVNGKLLILDSDLASSENVVREYSGNFSIIFVKPLSNLKDPTSLAFRPGPKRLVEIIDSEGNRISYTYNNQGLKEKEAWGGTRTFNYEKGQLSRIVDASGNTSTLGYDAAGRPATITDSDNNTNTIGYDLLGRVTSVTDPLGNLIKHTYDAAGRRTSTTDPRGIVTKFDYDVRDKLTQITEAFGTPAQKTTRLKYENEGRLSNSIDSLGNTTSLEYDPLGRVIKLTDPLGNTIRQTFDKAGNLLERIDALNNKTTYQYSPKANLLESVTNPLGHTQKFSYDSHNLLTRWDDGIKTTKFIRDSLGRLYQTYIESGVGSKADEIRQLLDRYGNPKTIRSTENFIQFEYDNEGRKTKITTFDKSTQKFSYNQRGLLSSATNGRGQRASLEYDKAGRLINVTDPDGTTKITYDKNSNTRTVTDSLGTLSREYDPLNRVTRFTDVYGNVIKYGYDKAGNLSKITYPDGKTVAYIYDALNRLVLVTDWAGRKTRYAYNANGMVTQITSSNNTTVSMNYDKASQLVSMANKKPNGSDLFAFSYTYNSAGQVLSEKGIVSPQITENRIGMGYDRGNRLAIFNTQKIRQKIIYDQDGNMTTGPIAEGNQTFSYDASNRLTGAGGLTYTYDAENRRVAKIRNNITTRFIVDPNAPLSQVLMETDSSGKPIAFYVYGLGLIGREDTNGSYRTYHYDLRGSTLTLTDGSGNATDDYRYGPFGELISVKGNTPNPFLYNGRDGVMTDENGLYHMRARYYNPYIKRFINKDVLLGSIENGQTLNRYAYVLGNPVNFVDPEGKLPNIAIGAIIGGGFSLYTSLYSEISKPGGLDWTDNETLIRIGIDVAIGTTTGALAASGAGLAAGTFRAGAIKFLTGAGISAGNEIAKQTFGRKSGCSEQDLNYEQIGIAAGIGGAVGVIGGRFTGHPAASQESKNLIEGLTGGAASVGLGVANEWYQY
jgi:RHS repeat-associated protein